MRGTRDVGVADSHCLHPLMVVFLHVAMRLDKTDEHEEFGAKQCQQNDIIIKYTSPFGYIGSHANLFAEWDTSLLMRLQCFTITADTCSKG